MSWLISLVLAGMVFSNDATGPVQKNNYTNTEATKIVQMDETERFEQTYPLSANGRVSVSNVNGSITIDTWERNEVKLEAVKTADDKSKLSEVEIQIDAQKDYLKVETNYDSWKSDGGNRGWKNYGRLSVEYHLTVPKNAVLDEIETVNGSVNITNSNNLTKASTVNGEVIANNLRGTANLSTVNGTVEANFDQLQSSSKITLETVNGKVNLTIPSDADATIKADTVNGSIVNDFGLPVRKGQYVGKDLYGKIGSGEVQIRLNSVNGGLNIKRKNDGKNVNPATNLLPQKSKEDDEDDWNSDDDGDSDSSVNVSKMNKDINKSVRESQKDAARQMKEAQKEMADAQKEMDKIRPELAKLNTAEMQAKIDESMKIQRETMARLADANFLSGAPVIEKKDETFTVKGTPKVSVDAKNCAVSVRGWDKSEVQYSITRISKRRNQKPLEFTAEHSDSEVKIRINGGKDSSNEDYFGEAERLRVEVFVPKKSNLWIRTDREIRLENVSGDIDLKGADESINVRDVDGKLRVASADGRIRVIGFKGEIESQTADGDMNLEGDFQKITATTGDGNIILNLPDDASATIRANTESVDLKGIAPSRIKTVDVSEDSSVWRIGNGSANYNFTVADGNIIVRNANILKSN
jgi:DUF4097 and DUF4098 domain-containing protein YvlB